MCDSARILSLWRLMHRATLSSALAKKSRLYHAFLQASPKVLMMLPISAATLRSSLMHNGLTLSSFNWRMNLRLSEFNRSSDMHANIADRYLSCFGYLPWARQTLVTQIKSDLCTPLFLEFMGGDDTKKSKSRGLSHVHSIRKGQWQ